MVPENKELDELIQEDIRSLLKIPVSHPVGVEKKCEIVHKEMLLKYFRKMTVQNKVQNVRIFHENISECNLLGEKEDRIEAILQFNGERCYAGVTYGSQNGVPQYNLLDDSSLEKFTLEKSSLRNCVSRLGTDELVHGSQNWV